MSQKPPQWLVEESMEDGQPLNSAPSSSNNAPVAGKSSVLNITVKHKSLIHWVLKGATMCLCCLMGATAIIGIMSIDGVETAGKIFVGVYMVFFACLLFLFELLQVRPVEWLDHMLRRNFGFLYGTMGKSLFIIFIAFLSFGIGDPAALCYATGASLAGFGALELTLFLKYPELFEDDTE